MELDDDRASAPGIAIDNDSRDRPIRVGGDAGPSCSTADHGYEGLGDLATVLGRSENAVSQALRVLRQQGWVSSTRVGRAVSYKLEDEIVHDLLHWIGARHG